MERDREEVEAKKKAALCASHKIAKERVYPTKIREVLKCCGQDQHFVHLTNRQGEKISH